MKKMTLLVAVFFLCSLLLVTLSFSKIRTRLQVEAVKSVEIAVDLTAEKNKNLSPDLLKFNGLTAFCTSERAAKIKDCEKVIFVKTGEGFRQNAGTRYSFENNIVPEAARAGDFIIFNELIPPVNYQKLDRKNIITMHILKQGESEKLSREDIFKRFIRAAVERNIKVLVTPDIEMADKVKLTLAARGFKMEKFCSNSAPYAAGLTQGRILYKKSYALIIALIFPLFAFILLRLFKGVFAGFSVVTLISLLASVIIAGTLSETDFMLKLSMFSGAKVAMLLPPLVVFFLLAYENKKLFDRKSTGVISAVVLSLIVIAVIARSGNYSMPLLPFEKELREWFENIFIARPRLKEFMIGHPALLLGLYLYPKIKESREKITVIFLIALGFLGQTSIINTFCHPQADFTLSVLRTLYGLIIGAATGGILILCLKPVKKY